MGRGYSRLVVAVVVISLILPGSAQAILSQYPTISHTYHKDIDTTGSRFHNDKVTNTTGSPSYFASSVSLAGIGSFTDRSDSMLPIDIDGDGNLEMSVLTAQGLIEIFKAPDYKVIWISTPFPGGARSQLPYDIDGDGQDELMVGDGYGTIHVLDTENFEDSSLPSAVRGRIDHQFPVTSMDIIDFDNDTRPDIVAYCRNTQNLTYVRNVNASDGLALEFNKTKKSQILDTIDVADLDGDGKVEILGAWWTTYSDNGKLYRIDPETFEYTKQVNTPQIFGLEIVDLDGDSIMEILINAYWSVIVHSGLTLDQIWEVYHEQNERVWGATGGDFDNDGRDEIVTVEWNHGTDTASIAVINATNRTYESRDLLPHGVAVSISKMDIDNDTTTEIIIGNALGLTIFNVTTNGTPNHRVENHKKGIGYNNFGLDTMDWDDDGINELVSGNYQGMINIIDPLTGEIEAQIDHSPINMASVVVADVDMDGEEEIVAGNACNATIYYKNLTLRAVLESYIRSWDPPDVDAKNSVAVADIDGDMAPEVLVGTDDPSIYIYNGSTLAEVYARNDDDGRIRTMLATDLDGDGASEVIVGDTLGYLNVFSGPFLEYEHDIHIGYGPYGFAAGDLDNDGDTEIVVGSGVGEIHVLNSSTLIHDRSEIPDLGSEVWGITLHDLDDDGALEIIVGTGNGRLYVLNGSTLETIWVVEMGSWIGSYNSLLIEDLDGDGHLEIAVGSDGFVYVLRLLAKVEKPNLSVGEIQFMDLPGKESFEDGEDIEVQAPVTVTGVTMNVSIDFTIKPTDLNLTDERTFSTVDVELGPGTHNITAILAGQFGKWTVSVIGDADDRYSESDEFDNRATKELEVLEKYARTEWFLGQGTGIGRYGGLAIGDDDGDGIPELFAGNLEGFVQSYHLSRTLDSKTISRDLGQTTYGLLVRDVDKDGEVEVVVSTGDGWIYSYRDLGSLLEWKSNPTDGACYGLDAADLDNDGNLEVLLGCENSRLYLLDGRTGEVIGTKVLLFELWAIAIGDFMDDGEPDVIIGAQDGTIYILNGSGLDVEWSFRLGDIAIDDVVIQDIDVDGKNEIIFGDRNGNVTVVGYHGNESEDDPKKVPTIESQYCTGAPVKGIEVVDLVPEKGLEVVVGNEDGVVVLNQTLSPLVQMAIDGKLSGILAADVDKKGDVEMVVGTVRGDLLVLMVNGSGGSLTITELTSLPSIGTGLYGTAAKDIDGDLTPELIIGTSSGELRIYDGISKDIEVASSDMGTNLYGLEVADIDGDGEAELITGSGSETVCAYDGKGLGLEWCTDKLGNWSIALAVTDTDVDGDMEVVVGSGDKVHIIDGAEGTIEHTSISLGKHIMGLAVGNLDNDSRPEIVLGTDDGFLHMLDGDNLTKQWAILLDSWVVGLDIADLDGDGIGTIFAGTDSKVYEISLMDKEIRWEHDLGQSAWGITVGDFDNDAVQEIFVGTRDGKVVAFNGSSMMFEWSSRHLGVRAGWYNSLEMVDVDWDGQMELMVGSSGYIYLFGSGAVVPDPVPDASLEKVTIPKGELTHAQVINITGTVFNHAIVPISNLTVHLLHDGSMMDSMVIDHIQPLTIYDAVFQLEVLGGEHNISVVIDRYDILEEYNEKNNNITVSYYALQEKNLIVIGGIDGIYLSDGPVQDVEVTIFALVVNGGEEIAGGIVRFYWGDLNIIAEDTVTVKGDEEVVAAVNWTPTKAGEWDITVVVLPTGVDSDMGDNTGTRKVRVLTHPSVTITSVHIPSLMTEWQVHELEVNVTNSGEADTSGILVLYSDGDEVWRSPHQVLPSGLTNYRVSYMNEAGTYSLRFSMEDLALDMDMFDNSYEVNLTILERPDLSFSTISRPEDNVLKDGRDLIIGVVVNNKGDVDATARIKVYDNGKIFFDLELDVGAGNMTTIHVIWTATVGDHELLFRIEAVEPYENITDNNEATLFLSVPFKKVEEEGLNWAMISVMVVGILAPVIAIVIYYSQVQPVRAMYRQQAVEVVERPVRRKKRRKKAVKRPMKKVKKVKVVKKDKEISEEE